MSSNATSMSTESHEWSTWQIVTTYVITAIVFIGLILAVLNYGDRLMPATAAAEAATTHVAAAHFTARSITCCSRSFRFCYLAVGWGNCSSTLASRG